MVLDVTAPHPHPHQWRENPSDVGLSYPGCFLTVLKLGTNPINVGVVGTLMSKSTFFLNVMSCQTAFKSQMFY